MSDAAGPSLFTVEHAVLVAGTAAEVWAVFADFASYPAWNPYVLAIEGDVSVGGVPAVTIVQENWKEPMTVRPTIVRSEAPRVLHWHGQFGEPGIFDTDHSFHVEPLRDGRVRFVQREEFRGSLAGRVDDEARAFTRSAFRAMNEALAARVAEQRDALRRPAGPRSAG